MKIFISWSGNRSHALADSLREWIPLVLHYIEPWLSQTDIEAGQRWAEQVAKELETSNFGIVCITQENVSSPWVLFESGALAKSLQGSRVVPFLLDLEFRDITGPLAQFQAKKADRTGAFDIVQSLNQLSPHPIPEDRVKQLFDALWPELEKKIASIPKPASLIKHSRPQPEVLEELVANVRALDSRLRDVVEEGMRGSRFRSRRIHPMMLHEMGNMLGERPGDPIVLLMFSSMFRDEMPWLYELGMEAYRLAKDGNSDQATAARNRLLRAAEFVRRGPFPLDEFGLDPKMLHMMVREMDRLIESPPEPENNSGEASVPPSKPKRKRL
jgi:hypothetical protein